MIDPAKREAFRGVLQRMIDDGADEATITEATAKFKAKYDPQTSGGQAGGMGDVKMAESQPPPQPQSLMERFTADPRSQAITGPLKFAGNVAQSISTGPINAVAQAVQDKEGFGPVAWQAAKNVVKSTLNPIMPGPNPIQSSETSLERAGVDNAPRDFMTNVPGSVLREQAMSYSNGMTPADAGKYESGKVYQIPAHSPGLAQELGFVADMAAPIFPGITAIRAAGAASRASLRALAKAPEAIGKAIQDVGGLGQMNRVVSPLMRHERQAKNPIAETIFQNKWDLSDPANKFSKGASPTQMHERAVTDMKKWGTQLEGELAAGNASGATVEINPLIDAAVERFKAKAGKSPEFYAGIKDIDKVAEDFKSTAAAALKGGSAHDLLQAQGFKQYMGNEGAWQHIAKKKGIPLKADETTRSILAEEIYHDLNNVIDQSTPNGIKDINKKYSDAIAASQALGWRKLIESRGKALSLSDVVLGAEAIVHPSVIPLAIVNKASKSGTVASWMYRLGEKMRAAKTPQESARYLAAMKKKGMTEAQIAESMQDFSPQAVDIPRSYMGEGAEPLQPVPKYQFGERPQPPPPPADPMAGMFESARPPTNPGTPGFEGMASPQDIAARQAMAQAEREAVVRQDRPVRVPQPKEAPGGVQVLDAKGLKRQPFKPTIDKAPPKEEGQTRMGYIEANNRRILMKRYLREKNKYTPSQQEVTDELKKLGREPVPKIPEKEIIERKFDGRRTGRDLHFTEDSLRDGTVGYETVSVPVKEAPEVFRLHGEEFTKVKGGYDNLITYKDSKGRKYEFRSGSEKIHMDPGPNQAKIDRLTKALEKAKDPQTKKKIEALINKELPF